MKIETPFGVVDLYFHRNHYCSIVTPHGTGIVVNGVALAFRKSLDLIDGQWQMVEVDSQSQFYKNSSLNLRFLDWRRNGSPSFSAHTKISQWIEVFLFGDLNRGVYTQQFNEAERTYFQTEITTLQSQITQATEQISLYEAQIAHHTATLNRIP